MTHRLTAAMQATGANGITSAEALDRIDATRLIDEAIAQRESGELSAWAFRNRLIAIAAPPR